MTKVSIYLIAFLVFTPVALGSVETKIAVYGAENQSGYGSQLKIFSSNGTLLNTMLFQNDMGSPVSSSSLSIEDISYDAAGNVYALGKPNGSTLRTVFKSNADKSRMDCMFQYSTYSTTVDGGLAVSRDGNIAVYGAKNFDGYGTSLCVFGSDGTFLSEMIFQNDDTGWSHSINPNIEDVAFDEDGNVYALGKPNGSSLRTVFKSNDDMTKMNWLFQYSTYSSTVDGGLAVSRDGNIAVYGAKNFDGYGTSLCVFGSDGTFLSEMIFQNDDTGWSHSINPNIEDIAFDEAGNVYALGKPNGSSLRTVFKSNDDMTKMNWLFHDGTYSAAVDGSIAIYPIPEPASLSLLSMTILPLLRRKKHHSRI